MQHQNVFNSIMNLLPDNRPITALQIVCDYEKCPKNFTAISRTYDQDADADLWRETKILIGKPTTRYLCLSKTEGLPDYVIETLRIITEKEAAPRGFSMLSRTADNEQKAWRKKQIAYKLSKRSLITNAVTDIILCSKLKAAPEGFNMAGEINGILICYKIGTTKLRSPPPIPIDIQKYKINNNINEVEKALNKLNIGNKQNNVLPPDPNDNDKKIIQASPKRPAPKPPITTSGTLSIYTEIEGICFLINPNLYPNTEISSIIDMQLKIPDTEYDFQLERQILCTTRSNNSNLKNPFFQ